MKSSKLLALFIFFMPHFSHASDRLQEIEARLDKLEAALTKLQEKDDNSYDSKQNNKLNTARFSPGLWMEFHRLKLKDETGRPLSPEGAPLGALLDENSPHFEFAYFMNDENLKKYFHESYGLTWSGFMNIKESGPQIFALDVTYKSDQMADKVHCSSSLSIDSKTIIEFKSFFDTYIVDLTKTEISELSLTKGVYPIQIWLTCRTRDHNRLKRINGISATLNYRSPSSRALSPVDKEQLLHKI